MAPTARAGTGLFRTKSFFSSVLFPSVPPSLSPAAFGANPKCPYESWLFHDTNNTQTEFTSLKLASNKPGKRRLKAGGSIVNHASTQASRTGKKKRVVIVAGIRRNLHKLNEAVEFCYCFFFGIFFPMYWLVSIICIHRKRREENVFWKVWLKDQNRIKGRITRNQNVNQPTERGNKGNKRMIK